MSDNYDELIKQIKASHSVTAREYIPRLYWALRAENPNLSNEDINERIKKDLIDIWSRTTIFENMPNEFKNEMKRRAGRQSHKNVIDLSATRADQEREREREEPMEISVTTNGRHDWESEKKRVYETNHKDHNEEKDGIIKDQKLEIDKLKESLRERKEEIDELIKSVNSAAALKKDIAVADSLEYKALESQLYILQRENQELKQIAQMQMKQNPSDTFKPASEIPSNSSKYTDSPSLLSPGGRFEIEFPAKELSTLWADARIARQVMYLKIEGNKVVGWESDAQRAKNQARQAAKPA